MANVRTKNQPRRKELTFRFLTKGFKSSPCATASLSACAVFLCFALSLLIFLTYCTSPACFGR